VVADALSAIAPAVPLVDRRGKPISIETAIPQLFTGLAFLAVAVVLGISGGGRNWWYWLLIPAFTIMGAGVAQLVRIRLQNSRSAEKTTAETSNSLSGSSANALPPQPAASYVAPESKFRTGDLVPPSVTDGTTRHLEIDKEGQTMPLKSKKQD
jgi:hypothetical protein